MIVTMEASSVFPKIGDFQKDWFLKDDLAKYNVSAAWLFVVSMFSLIFPIACCEKKIYWHVTYCSQMCINSCDAM